METVKDTFQIHPNVIFVLYLSQPLFLPFNVRFWKNSGLRNIGDLYINAKFASLKQLCEKYSIPSNHFFRYLQIRDFVKCNIDNYVTATPMYLDTFLERCLRDGSTISLLYKGLEQLKSPSMENIKSTWEEELAVEIPNEIWEQSLELVHRCSINARHCLIQCFTGFIIPSVN